MVGMKHINVLPQTLSVVYSFPGHNYLLQVWQHSGFSLLSKDWKLQHIYWLHTKYFTEMQQAL